MQQRAWILPTALLAALALTGLGCDTITNKITEKATESIIENSIENNANGDVDVDFSDGTVNFKGEDGAEVSYGQNLSLPSDFPSAVPLYKNGSIVSTSKTQEDAHYVMTTKDSSADVVAWFEAELSGWTKESSFDGQGFSMRVYSRAEEKLTLSTGSSADSETSITVSYQHAGVK